MLRKSKVKTKSKGSISLEAALVVPILWIFMGVLYLYIFSIHLDLIYQESAYNAVREYELLLTLNQDEDFLAGSDEDLKEKVKTLAVNKISAEALSLRQNYWLNKSMDKQVSKYFIRKQKTNLYNDQRNSLRYEYSYESPKILGGKEYTYSLPIPYWGSNDLSFLNSDAKEETDSEDSSIWSEHNFTRGKYFRDKYGANLPNNYPVIAKFNAGTITSIKSIDLTAPSYASTNQVEETVENYLNEVLNFKGTENWGKNKISIRENEITRRELILVVPENSSESAKITLNELKNKWNSKGVYLNVHYDAESKRYE